MLLDDISYSHHSKWISDLKQNAWFFMHFPAFFACIFWWFQTLTVRTKRTTAHESPWKTGPENGVFSWVLFCSRSLIVPFERCDHFIMMFSYAANALIKATKWNANNFPALKVLSMCLDFFGFLFNSHEAAI